MTRPPAGTPCRDCGGAGVVGCPACRGAGGEWQSGGGLARCPACGGAGTVPCGTCDGEGVVMNEPVKADTIPGAAGGGPSGI